MAALETRTITRISMFTGKENTRTLTAPPEEWALLESGTELIQHAMPSLSNSEREFLITGSTDEEWDSLFPEEDEEED